MTVEARRFAIKQHGAQQYGPYPYQYHLAMVADIVTEFLTELTVPGGASHAELTAAAWLHDVLEDTDATIGTLHRKFGPDVTALVVAVTEPPGESRRERHVKTYPKIRAAGRQAVGLKLCDRTANLRACRELGNDDMFRMYESEQHGFVRALHQPGELEGLWEEIARAFNHSWPV